MERTGKTRRRRAWMVLAACLSVGPAGAQTRPAGVIITRPIGGDVADAIRLLEATAQVEEDEAAPATGPSSRPSERLSKFRIRYQRTPVNALRALSAAAEPDQDEAAKFQADVQAGRWEEVGKAIATFSPAEAKTLYRHLITDLMTPPQPQPQGPSTPGMPVEPPPPRAPGVAPQIFLGLDDVLGVIAAAPGELEQDLIDLLGQLLARVVSTSGVIDPFIARLDQGIRGMGGPDPANRQRAAALLVAASRPLEAAAFLPTLNPDLNSNDVSLLDLHSRCLTAQSSRDDSRAPQAWTITRALMAHPQANAKQRDAAMSRALELLPRLAPEAAAQWLDSVFRPDSEQGATVLAGAGAAVSQNFLSRDLARRERDLLAQKTVVGELLKQTQDLPRWSPLLRSLAALWMQEADYTRIRPSRRTAQQRVVYDEDGNAMVQPVSNPNEPQPLDPLKILAAAPADGWLAALDPAMQAAVRVNLAQMQFKNDSPAEAMPVIESLASAHPKLSRDLANELLRNLARVWSMNLVTNRQVGYYVSSSGSYTPVTQSMVLTRLAQARNLAELSELLDRMQKLGGEPLEPSAVVSAFVSAHSPAEVFAREHIEKVFGPVEQMNRDSLLTLTSAMRQRLATSWRSPAVQQQQQTKRNDKETDVEVTRGYQLLIDLLKQRQAREPDWRLSLVQASGLFDWAEFDYGKQVELAIYTARRDEAFAMFGQAAAQYVAALPSIKPAEQSAQVYMQWFSAALGASDLAALTRQSTPSPTQLEQIRAALFSVPSDARERHLAGFGKFLADSIGAIRPELKHRFLTTGIKLLGDHPSARDAQILVRYYEELLEEIELHAEVDGDAIIGHDRPFGLYLVLRHTQTLGRESGGFARYLSGQATTGGLVNSNGQPISFRDDVEKQIRESLVERFEVTSIAWHDSKVEPMAYGKPGWRQTPLAYVLLKPKDASADRIPPIQMDLDMLDRQGSVILPISSQVLLVDARPDSVPARPLSKVEITQILDLRDVNSGTLSLDIKATAHGLVPEIGEVLDVNIPGFKIDKTSDLGLVINRMDATGERPAPVSERSWLIHLSAAQKDNSPLTFRFPQSRVTGAAMTYKQYSDADVADVDPQLAVTGLPIRSSRGWIYVLIGALAALAISAAAWLLRRSGRDAQQATAPRYQMPTSLTPFTVLDLLQRMEADSSLALATEHRQHLTNDIRVLQEHYFAPTPANSNGDDLSKIASRWLQAAGGR